MSEDRLTVFETDQGYTLAFGQRTYFVASGDPFYRIARKSLEQGDYVPFYIYMARQEGVGEAFRDRLREAVRELKRERDEDGEDDEDDWRIT